MTLTPFGVDADMVAALLKLEPWQRERLRDLMAPGALKRREVRQAIGLGEGKVLDMAVMTDPMMPVDAVDVVHPDGRRERVIGDDK